MAFPLGVVRDANVDYLLEREWLNPISFVTAATSTSLGPATLTSGFGVTGGLVAQVGNRRIAAIRLDVTAATIGYVWRPYKMDNRWPVYVRVAWTTDAAVASVATFTHAFSTITAGAAPATPSTGWTTAPVGVGKAAAAHAWTWTRWGAIAATSGSSLPNQTFPDSVEAINFNIAVSSLTLAAVATDFVYVYGVEVAYTPRRTFGDGSGREARYMDQIMVTGPSEAGATLGIKT